MDSIITIDWQQDFSPMPEIKSVFIKRWDSDHVIIKIEPTGKISDMKGKFTFPNGCSVSIGIHKISIKDLPLWLGICSELDGLISEIIQ